MNSALKYTIKKINDSKCLLRYPKLTFGSLMIVILATMAIVTATFSQLPIVHFAYLQNTIMTLFHNSQNIEDINKYFYYIPQIPIILIIGGILGPRLGFLSVLIYFILGIIGFPIFASGGGYKVLANPYAGYIFGYFFGVVAAGKNIKEKLTFKSLTKATFWGVLSIHITGIIYLTVVLLLNQQSFYSIMSWICVLTGFQFLYDMIFGCLALLISKPLKLILWPIMM